jgi:integrase
MNGQSRIDAFLRLYPKNSTVTVYRAAIYNFLDLFYGKQRKGKRATRAEMAQYEALAERYFTEGRNYYEDLLSYTTAQANRPPIPAKAAIAGVKEWLGFHGLELTQRELKQLANKRPKGKTGRTAEIDIDVPMLKRILTHMDAKGRALVLVLASSGMRIGEALTVKLDDVRINENPAEIVVRGETSKTGDQRTVFISTEAREAVQEWLKVRADYLAAAAGKNTGLLRNGQSGEKATEDDRLFPFTDNNVREIWRNTLRRAQLLTKDNGTGLIQMRIHGLRKFFRSQLALSCPVDIVEALMGHEGYLTEAYRRFSKKQMGEYYLKAEHHVTVMGAGDLIEVRERLQDTRAEVRGYKDIITEQAEEMADLRKELEEMKGEFVAMKAKEEAREPYDAQMTELIKRLIANPELKELIKREWRR